MAWCTTPTPMYVAAPAALLPRPHLTASPQRAPVMHSGLAVDRTALFGEKPADGKAAAKKPTAAAARAMARSQASAAAAPRAKPKLISTAEARAAAGPLADKTKADAAKARAEADKHVVKQSRFDFFWAPHPDRATPLYERAGNLYKAVRDLANARQCYEAAAKCAMATDPPEKHAAAKAYDLAARLSLELGDVDGGVALCKLSAAQVYAAGDPVKAAVRLQQAGKLLRGAWRGHAAAASRRSCRAAAALATTTTPRPVYHTTTTTTN